MTATSSENENERRTEVGRDLLDVASREPDDDDSTVPGDDLERGDDHTDGVVDTTSESKKSATILASFEASAKDSHIDTSSLCDLLDLVLPDLGISRVINRIIRTVSLADLEFLRASSRSNNDRTERFSDLESGESDSSGTGVDEDNLSRLDIRSVDEGGVRGGVGDEESCGFGHGHTVGSAGRIRQSTSRNR